MGKRVLQDHWARRQVHCHRWDLAWLHWLSFAKMAHQRTTKYDEWKANGVQNQCYTSSQFRWGLLGFYIAMQHRHRGLRNVLESFMHSAKLRKQQLEKYYKHNNGWSILPQSKPCAFQALRTESCYFCSI